MWCKQCRQDVPSVPTKAGKLHCLRCGSRVASDATTDGSIHVAAGVAAMGAHGLDLDDAGRSQTRPSLDFDEWDFDPDLRAFENARAASRLAAMPAAGMPGAGLPPGVAVGAGLPGATGIPGSGFTYAAHAASMPGWHPSVFAHGMQPPLPMTPPANRRQENARRASWLAWTVLSIGLMMFCCGGMLLGWSMISERADLWSLGIPVAVGGQIGLLVGLVLQLERIWQNNRYAVDKLEEVDERLADMKHAQSLLQVNHGTAAQAFYSHMAEGANPSLLLADLKGQLDLLAVRLAERHSK